ncbi:MAG TPA: surface-adhesin E family protein [Pyrinomonadaceae bacterium]|nr:surface-adhesin E family protein [Pyrinomonadaceae bacterium]
MRIVILTYIFVLSGPSLLAQQSPVWDRVYTFDDSMIEMNTSDLVIGGNIARATFRWTFDQPEILSGQPQQRYKSRNEVFEFNCIDKRYRPYEISFVDAAGKLIRTEEGNPPAKWLAVDPGSMIDKLFTPACQLFNERTLLSPSNEAIELESQ